MKDRIESQILTHYPKTLETAQKITEQEANIHETQQTRVQINPLARELIEQIAFEARDSEYVDSRSGVSARLTIAGFENLMSAAERRALIFNEKTAFVRISDFWGVIPAITGKIELVYEGEQEGPLKVAQILIGKAIRTIFPQYFPNPDKFKKAQERNPYQKIINWFGEGNTVDILSDCAVAIYRKELLRVPGLKELVNRYHSNVGADEQFFLMEFALHGLAEYSFLSKYLLESGLRFKDLLSGMFNPGRERREDDDLSDMDFYR